MGNFCVISWYNKTIDRARRVSCRSVDNAESEMKRYEMRFNLNSLLSQVFFCLNGFTAKRSYARLIGDVARNAEIASIEFFAESQVARIAQTGYYVGVFVDCVVDSGYPQCRGCGHYFL